MNYTEALEYLGGLVPTLARPTMERMQNYFGILDDPQNRVPVVHVGGTNGKGSVTTMVAAMLTALGFKCGKFTGPHLDKFNERFVIDGRIVDDSTFASLASKVQEQSHALIEQYEDSVRLTWFEFLMAMAVAYFNQESVAVAVYEVGLGGRFDATNVLQNVAVSVITNVDLDHVHLLGDTRAKIASEKSGIMRTGVPLVTACSGEALEVVRERSRILGAPLLIISNLDAQYQRIFSDYDLAVEGTLDALSIKGLCHLRQWLSVQGDKLDNLGLKGAYQRVNTLTALIAVTVYMSRVHRQALTAEQLAICLGALQVAQWPGRFEILESQPIIVDGAHNGAGARALRQSLNQYYPGKSLIFVFACFENKDYKAMLSELLQPGDTIFAPLMSHKRPTRFAPEICQYAQSLGAQSQSCPDYQSACKLAIERLSREPERFGDRFVVTGSFALVKEAQSGRMNICSKEG
ncbi:MAG: hypothetical protein IPI39_24825 [Candidatus Obscuribacter sp.]|nr:hypothetical protein [Candidatus Obscuribacter sp.]MBK9618577.1 hypothetical protein [Candidatus Obscuribacter sp.]